MQVGHHEQKLRDLGLREEKGEISVGKKKCDVILTRSSSAKPSSCCLVLGHGASGDATTGNLPAIAKAVATSTSVSVLRYTCSGQLPSRTAILKGLIDSGNAILDTFTTWILSGHSMGGRTACSVARGRTDIKGLILISYPLHPPGKETELRDGDLTVIKAPVLIVRGSNDAFSTEEKFQEVMHKMTSEELEIHIVEKGDHSLNTKNKKGQERFNQWIDVVIDFVRRFGDEAATNSTFTGKKGPSKRKAHTPERQVKEKDTKRSSKNLKSNQ